MELLSLVSKFNINLLKILEIPKEYLRTKFLENYDKIKEHKYRLGIACYNTLFEDGWN